MWAFYLFASLLVIQAVISLRGGFRYLAYVRRETGRKREEFTPYASVIAPCRGFDQGLRDNLAALFHQDYPAYEIIFVTDSDHDPALAVIEELRQERGTVGPISSRVVIAGEAEESGQKVHNLLAAVGESDPASEVLVFVDSDARPRPGWLRSLVAPLKDERTGAATGYRWFISQKGGFPSALLSVWNASVASALGENGDRNFCWGGSTAIRRATFERIGMAKMWRGTLSDDYAMTRTLHRSGLPIRFAPDCLTSSYEDCNLRGLLEFTTRQIKITRVYAPALWKIVLFSNLLFVLTFFGGIALVLARAALGLPIALPLALLLAIYALGSMKAYLRLRAVGLPLSPYRRELRRAAPSHLFMWPLASALFLYNALAALFSRRITWRGIAYELKSPEETVIIGRQNSGVRNQDSE